jgi:hypothetical protein
MGGCCREEWRVRVEVARLRRFRQDLHRVNLLGGCWICHSMRLYPDYAPLPSDG